jgi:hypothetical protein
LHDLGVIRNQCVGQNVGSGGVVGVTHFMAPAGIDAKFASRKLERSAVR